MADLKLSLALKDGINVDEIVTTGEVPLTLDDTVWVDLFGYTVARNLDNTRGHVDFNFNEATTDFDANADITNNRDSVTINYQLNHFVDRETANVKARPHFHWFQENSGVVRWVSQYRILENGKEAGAWSTQAVTDTTLYAYVSGKLVQITSLPDVPIKDVSISSIIQVRLWRDGTNVGDTYGSTKAKILSMDAHVPQKYLGSKDEFVQ